MLSGSLVGNLIGVFYFISFLASGLWLSRRLLTREKQTVRIFLGLVTGCVLLMWLPVAFSFLLGFNKLSHLLALLLLLVLDGLTFFFTRKNAPPVKAPFFDKETRAMLLLLAPMLLYYGLVLSNHTFPAGVNGDLMTGQSTYGDMNLHLSFITTPVAQGMIPFHYNILPSAQVSYPFLSDTISSSIYLWGASLRLSYMLPMLVAAACVFGGAFLFFSRWLKNTAASVLSWVLFFFNGGFGIFYFLDGLRSDSSNFTRIFTSYYETPTNLADKTVRWVNTVVDMMIPQRATLFGWMMLFACLYLLYRAVFEKDKKYYLYAGIMAGLTPLINTHIFLSLAIICAFWMISRMAANSGITRKTAGSIAIGVFVLTTVVFLFSVASSYQGSLASVNYDAAGMAAFLIGALCMAGIFLFFLFTTLKNGGFREMLTTWGVLLIAVLVLALPQIFGVTLKQAGTSSSFLFAHFNWVNSQDTYLWFYLKNMGLPFLLLLPALLSSNARMLSLASPAAFLVLLADTVSLQPNTYDNNKLIYPAFALLCGVIAWYLVRAYKRLLPLGGTKILAVFVVMICTCSAVLTMGREYVSNVYTIYEANQVAAANWIEENTPGDSTVLTNDRINNAVSSLTGRDIVCGSNTLLYFHGHADEYVKRQQDVNLMYADPTANRSLFDTYSVDYVMVSGYETSSYVINEDALASLFELVYNENGVKVYQVK